MKCERCQGTVSPEEEREWHGKRICEECYMDVLSPTRTCDPWAVHSAKTFSENQGEPKLSETQENILKLLKETGGLEPQSLAEKANLSPADLEREIATLRHMEKVRAQLKEGKKVLCLW